MARNRTRDAQEGRGALARLERLGYTVSLASPSNSARGAIYRVEGEGFTGTVVEDDRAGIEALVKGLTDPPAPPDAPPDAA
jgi:hypothetical protein